jgi:hypothetical protein
MAEEKVEVRDANWRQLLPWTELFRGFQVALDLNKLLLAAAGIFVMAFGWWLLSVIFSAGKDSKPPDWPGDYKSKYGDEAWAHFKADRDNWNLMNEAAGLSENARWEVKDLASTETEYSYFGEPSPVKTEKEYLDRIEALHQQYLQAKEAKKEDNNGFTAARRQEYLAKAPLYAKLDHLKPYGRLATWPWSEDRGPNPYLLVTGQAGIPWEPGHFWDWLTTQQIPVLIEPLVKLVRPILYFLSPRAQGFFPRLYFFLAFLWTVLVWAFFGGAITRIAAVQVARGEKIGLTEACRYVGKRYLSYMTPPLFPLGIVFVLVIFAAIYGLFGMIPAFGDIVVSGLLWVIPLVLGLVMAVFLVGLAVGWPLMAPTISAEGTDSWEAVSRPFGYIYNKPGHYIWYCFVSVVYGAAVVFLVVFLGSFMVYMSKWGVARTPLIETANREPSYLFVYAPTSFGWRTLLLDGAKVGGVNVVENGQINRSAYDRYMGWDTNFQDVNHETLSGWNKAGAGLVAFWLGLVFLLILGFGYSFYFTASTIMYMLLRKNVDAAELDEVYLEEDDLSGTFAGPLTAPPPPPAPPSAVKPVQPTTMVEPPALRPPSPAPAPAPVNAPAPSPPPPAEPTAEPPAKDGADNPPAAS